MLSGWKEGRTRNGKMKFHVALKKGLRGDLHEKLGFAGELPKKWVSIGLFLPPTCGTRNRGQRVGMRWNTSRVKEDIYLRIVSEYWEKKNVLHVDPDSSLRRSVAKIKLDKNHSHVLNFQMIWHSFPNSTSKSSHSLVTISRKKFENLKKKCVRN